MTHSVNPLAFLIELLCLLLSTSLILIDKKTRRQPPKTRPTSIERYRARRPWNACCTVVIARATYPQEGKRGMVVHVMSASNSRQNKGCFSVGKTRLTGWVFRRFIPRSHVYVDLGRVSLNPRSSPQHDLDFAQFLRHYYEFCDGPSEHPFAPGPPRYIRS